MLNIACLPWLFHSPGIIFFLSRVPKSCCLLLASLFLSIHQDSSLYLTTYFQQGHWFVGCCWPPSDYSIQQNHLCLLRDHRAISLLGVASLLLTIPSNRIISVSPGNIFGVIHTPGIISLSLMLPLIRPQLWWVLLAFLWLFHPPGLFSFYSLRCLTRLGWYWGVVAFSWTFISQESPFNFTRTLPFSRSSRHLFSPLPSFINGSQAGN